MSTRRDVLRAGLAGLFAPLLALVPSFRPKAVPGEVYLVGMPEYVGTIPLRQEVQFNTIHIQFTHAPDDLPLYTVTSGTYGPTQRRQ